MSAPIMVLMVMIAMLLVMAMHDNEAMMVPIFVVVSVVDDRDVPAPIFVMIPVVDDRDMAVAVTVMVVIALADVHRHPLVLRHNHCVVSAVRSREGRHREKGNRSHRQS